MVEELNEIVSAAHYAHYAECATGLVDTSAKASPNENQIYHLYSTGKITHQKGAWAYQQRSEFTLNSSLAGAKKRGFKFPLQSDQDETVTYAILTKIECHMYRMEMEKIIDESKYRMSV